jgi:Ca2+/Na+ antiporter
MPKQGAVVGERLARACFVPAREKKEATVNALLLIALILLLVWVVLIFDFHLPLWITYLMGVLILLLLFAWFASLFRKGPPSDGGRGRAV